MSIRAPAAISNELELLCVMKKFFSAQRRADFFLTGDFMKRIYSVDVLRGIPILIMLFLDSPPDKIFSLLEHTPWNGLTVADIPLPAFAFAMGVSAAISFSRNKPTMKKILRRVAIMFALGIFLNFWFTLMPLLFNGFTIEKFFDEMIIHGRLFGILQRLALTYLFAVLIIRVIKNELGIFAAAFVLTILSSAGFHIYAPENPFDEIKNISNAVDLIFPGENHIYTPIHDPEGLYGCISGTASVLFGYVAGKILIVDAYLRDKCFLLGATGAALIFSGALWSTFDIVSKKLWTAPFTLLNAGGDLILLVLLMILVDGEKFPRAKKFFKIFGALGTNPLFFFLANNVVVTLICHIPSPDEEFGLYEWLYHHTTAGFITPEFGATLFCAIWCLLWLPLAEIFYRRGIVIKI